MLKNQLTQIARKLAESTIDEVVGTHGDELIDRALSSLVEKFESRFEQEEKPKRGRRKKVEQQ